MVTREAESSIATLASHDEACINLNIASAKELGRLPRIGPSCVIEIIKGQQWSGIGELTGIAGLGSARVSAIASSSMVCELYVGMTKDRYAYQPRIHGIRVAKG